MITGSDSLILGPVGVDGCVLVEEEEDVVAGIAAFGVSFEALLSVVVIPGVGLPNRWPPPENGLYLAFGFT